jgi:Zn-dependent protease with chaperone function
MVVSLAHSIFEMLAFKNEIHFWKNRDSLKGISVRSLFINLGMQILIFFYLMDKEGEFWNFFLPADLKPKTEGPETSYLIVVPAFLAIIIE